MFYKTAFWILTFLTAVSALLQFLGYDFLNILIVLLIFDSLSFGAVVEIERKKSLKEMEVGKTINQKIDDLEKICRDVLQKVSMNSAVMELEEKLNRHKEDEKTSLDKIAEKTLDLEKKINRFGAKLAEHLKEIAEEIKEEKDESVGDYIYMDEEE
jgi:DNA anti-recombination protein RmuC